jgi:hypothetical protein
MERGHVPDSAHGQVNLASWLSGPPQHQRFFGGIKPRYKEQIPLTAFRCTGCGYVELYASTTEDEE